MCFFLCCTLVKFFGLIYIYALVYIYFACCLQIFLHKKKIKNFLKISFMVTFLLFPMFFHMPYSHYFYYCWINISRVEVKINQTVAYYREVVLVLMTYYLEILVYKILQWQKFIENSEFYLINDLINAGHLVFSLLYIYTKYMYHVLCMCACVCINLNKYIKWQQQI